MSYLADGAGETGDDVGVPAALVAPRPPDVGTPSASLAVRWCCALACGARVADCDCGGGSGGDTSGGSSHGQTLVLAVTAGTSIDLDASPLRVGGCEAQVQVLVRCGCS